MSKRVHAHDHHGHEAEHANHGTLRGYLIGFFLSVNLTVIPFWLVMGRPLDGLFASPVPVALLLMLFAVVQMVVHMVYFLHMHPKSEGGWSLLALFFTLILVIIVMSGSMWVMYHLNTNMMPVHDMSTMDTTGEGWVPSAASPTQVVPAPAQQP
jgi:cytochrome o ubiquinol oxidase operon protein cyoD